MTREQDQNNGNDPQKIDGLTKLSDMLNLANRIKYNRQITALNTKDQYIGLFLHELNKNQETNNQFTKEDIEKMRTVCNTDGDILLFGSSEPSSWAQFKHIFVWIGKKCNILSEDYKSAKELQQEYNEIVNRFFSKKYTLYSEDTALDFIVSLLQSDNELKNGDIDYIDLNTLPGIKRDGKAESKNVQTLKNELSKKISNEIKTNQLQVEFVKTFITQKNVELTETDYCGNKGINKILRLKHTLDDKFYYLKNLEESKTKTGYQKRRDGYAAKKRRLEVSRAAIMRFLLPKNTTKYFLMQHNSQEYVASKEVKRSQTLFEFLANKTSGDVNRKNTFDIMKLINDDNLLKQYIEIQEANLLIGNNDAHFNNILLKTEKNGKDKLVVIDFDSECSNVGLDSYNKIKKILQNGYTEKYKLIQIVKDDLRLKTNKSQQLKDLNFFIDKKVVANNTEILPEANFRQFMNIINSTMGTKIKL